jgi:hypothetical protein
MAGGGAGLGAGNPEYLQRVMGGASSGVNRLPESRAERASRAAPQARQQTQEAQVQTQVAPQPQPAAQPANYQYITEGNRDLKLPTNQRQVFEQLQNYYAPSGMGYVRPGAPSKQELKQMANQIASAGSAYGNTADKVGNLYADFVEGRMPKEEYVDNLKKMQALSRTAAGQYEDVNRIFENPMFNPAQTVAGVPQQRNTLGLNPAQRFTLPKETWNMKPQELMNWIQRHEKNAGKDSFMGNAAWVVGPALIGGAAATGITGITGPSVINSAIGSGIENLTGMTSKASGGIVNLLRSKS